MLEWESLEYILADIRIISDMNIGRGQLYVQAVITSAAAQFKIGCDGQIVFKEIIHRGGLFF